MNEALEPGPIPTSEPLREMLRLLRALAELLPGQSAELEPVARDVGLQFIETVEKNLGVTLPFDVITLAVLRVPLFRRATGLSVAHIEAVVRDCAGDFGAPRGWVAVASFGEQAMRADVPLAHAGYDTLLCLSKTARDRHGDPDVRVTDGQDVTAPQKLSTFVRERLARRYGLSEKWMEALRRARTDARAIDEACIARFVDDRPKAAPAVRVRHAKFGEGTIVRVVEGDKVEIAFDSAGTKTLLRKFVQDVS